MKRIKEMTKVYLIFSLIALSILFISCASVSAIQSNESMNSQKILEQSKQDIVLMSSRNIPITRANESLQQAIQLYAAQYALEEAGKKADYTLVNQYALEVSSIKDNAIKASDELKIFDQTYTQTAQDTNLSEMDADYKAIHKSFTDERFEDTLGLIDKGYQRMSEIQASQTALKLYYDTTSRNIKNFFKNNWKQLLIGLAIAIILLIIFGKAIKRIRINLKIHNLTVQKSTLKELIKGIQTDYFKYGRISDTEYQVKLETFTEMIRDIDRQIPLLKEEIAKLQTNTKIYTDSSETKEALKPVKVVKKRRK